ncbi:MAG: gnl 1 [Verrucomicrobiales bacterium]|nr:gnl 1 [Verrucomicrobiales bacterium]
MKRLLLCRLCRAPRRRPSGLASVLFLAVAAALFTSGSVARADDPTPRPTRGEIIRLDPAFDALVPPGAVLEVLASGLDWSEGPVWDPARGVLLFSDVPQNTVFQWKEGEGLSPFLKPSGYTGPLAYSRESGSNGLVLDAKGRLISCEHGDRRLSLLGPGGGKRTLTDNFEGKRYNSPNDACVDKAGNIFFTDPPYGLPKGPADQDTREIPWNGVYRLTPEGKVTLLTKDLKFPNGVALSPDEKTLYVAQSDSQAALWMAYPLNPDGTLGTGRVFADVTAMAKTGHYKGLPDGLKVDAKGNLWATAPGGVHVMSPEGKLLGRIETFTPTGNCCFGGANNEYLYICADAWICRVKLTNGG